MVDNLKDFYFAQKNIYKLCGLTCTHIQQELESKEYGACSFEIGTRRVLFRAAKITPTKVGQFVTIWKRIGSGPIMPFDQSDPIDLFVIHVRSHDRFGQFVFPTMVLSEQGYVSFEGKGGKRAMRVYPSWDTPMSKHAQKTQAWQLKYFFEANISDPIDKDLVMGLFSKTC